MPINKKRLQPVAFCFLIRVLKYKKNKYVIAMANQFLSLSLFLMLLSFFIVMNSISSFEENKAQPVLNSLNQAFTNIDIEIKKPAKEQVENAIERSLRKGDTLEAIEGVFNAHIAGFEAKRNRLGTIMHVKLPIGRFESAIDIDGYENYRKEPGAPGAFAQTLVTLIRSVENGGRQYRIDMILNVDQDPAEYQTQTPDDFAKDIKRVSKLATTLEQTGLPQKMMSIGMKQGQPSMVDVFIRRYAPLEFDEPQANTVEDL